MTRLRIFLSRLRGLVRGRSVDRDLQEEIAAHVEEATDEYVQQGLSRADARRAAMRSLGGVAQAREAYRDVRSFTWLENVARDVRYAVRSLGRAPGFTLAAVFTLALGIGGTTATFSVVDSLFLRAPAGVTDPSSVRRVFVQRNAGQMTSSDGSAGMWSDAQTVSDGSQAFAGIAAYQSARQIDMGRGESAERVSASVVSPDFFTVLGVRPAVGRLFLPDDDAPGAHAVVVSHTFWQQRLGGTDDALGRTLLVNNRPVQIIGVVERGFHGIDADAVDVWVPAAMAEPLGLEFASDWRTRLSLSSLVHHVARLRSPDVGDRSAAEASAALAHAAASEPRIDPTPEVRLRSLVVAELPGLSWAVDLSLWLLVAAGLVLAMSITNVANLLVARGIARQREFAMRIALGAGSWRVARQQLTESLVLALLGGVAGVVVASLGVGVMRQFPLPPTAGQIDGRLFGFSALLSLTSALAFGVLPALRQLHIDPVRALKAPRVVSTLRRAWSRPALLVVQVSVSFCLLVGAALFARSLGAVASIDGGADLDRLLTVELNLADDGGDVRPVSERYRDFFEDATVRLSATSGVQRTAVVYMPPFEGWGWGAFWRVPGEEGYREVITYLNLVGPGYFETTGTTLQRGRTIAPFDDLGAEPVAVVNEALARLISDQASVVGTCLEFRAPQIDRVPCLRVIGVVESQRNRFLDPEPVPTIFRSAAQVPGGIPNHSPMLLVRTTDHATGRAPGIRAALQGLRADLPFVSVAPLAERLTEVRPFRIGALLFGLFAALALLLSAVGLCGVLGYFVTERAGEIGIRRALGAPAAAVVWLVLRQGLVPVVVGLILGLAGALVGGRIVQSRLFGIAPHDPASLAGGVVCLLVVAVLATVLPVRRALGIDPNAALRQE